MFHYMIHDVHLDVLGLPVRAPGRKRSWAPVLVPSQVKSQVLSSKVEP